MQTTSATAGLFAKAYARSINGPSRRSATLGCSRAPTRLTPLGAILRGGVAGAVGTLAMDTLLFARYRRSSGVSPFRDWEFSAGVKNWEDAPAPAQVGRRLVEGLFQRKLPVERVALVNNLTHWAYGIMGGGQYGVLAGSSGAPRLSYGLPFGAGVWAAGYAILPAAKLYQPIWHYDGRTLANDLTAHLVYGLATAAVFQVLPA